MPNEIHLWRPDSRKDSKISISPNGQFPISGNEGCQRVQVRVYRGSRFRELPMVTKQPWLYDPEMHETQVGVSGVDRYISIWRQLIKSDIPTLPTVRKVSKNTVLITDLTRDGSIIYGKHQALELGSLSEDPASQIVHRAFLGIDLRTVELASKNIFDKATKNQIALASDGALELVVSPTGSWNLVALDLVKTWFNTGMAKGLNGFSHATLLYDLSTLRDHFQSRVHLYNSN